MPRPVNHAPDGGTLIAKALCEESQGDIVSREADVDCGECLDLLDNAGQELMHKLRKTGFEFA